MISTEEEARILTRYLINEVPSKVQVGLYSIGSSSSVTAGRERAWDIVLNHPWLLPYFDAYDALFRPDSQLRKKLYIMFSILEASPDFVEKFLPQKRSLWYLLILAGVGIRSIYRLLMGVVFVKVGRF